MKGTVAENLAKLELWRMNTIKMENDEWTEKVEAAIDKYVDTKLPHGSGFGDAEINYILEDSLCFYSSYNVMNENGFYEGSADFRIYVRASLVGHKITLVGKSKWPRRKAFDGLADYILEVYDSVLSKYDEFMLEDYLPGGAA